MEYENNYLREELDNVHEQVEIKDKFEKSSAALEGLISNHIYPYDRYGLGYKSGEKAINDGETFEYFKEKGKPRSYAEVIKRPNCGGDTTVDGENKQHGKGQQRPTPMANKGVFDQPKKDP